MRDPIYMLYKSLITNIRRYLKYWISCSILEGNTFYMRYYDYILFNI